MVEDNIEDITTIESKRRKLPQLVLLALIDGGKTIEELALSKNLVNLPIGAPEQIQHQSKSIWHNKPEIDEYVRQKLGISDTEWGAGDSNRESVWFSYVAQEISKLRKDGTITDWNLELRTGFWRLTHLKGITSSEPNVELNVNSDDDPEIIVDNGRKSPFWIASGSWKSWNHTINNRPIRWGTKDENLWNILQLNDIVFCSASSKSDRIFNDNGIFMVGKVTRKYELDENDGYFPDSENVKESFFKYRFELEPLKIVQTDNELLPLVPGLSPRRAINHITNPQVIKDILRNLEDKWNIKLDSFQINPESSLFKDPETTLPLLSSKDIDEGYDLISKELFIPKEKIIEIITALLSGRHILLAGPIGTGKTRLATLIPEIFWKKWGGYASEDHTATSDWSTLDVIGGILPKMEHDEPKYVIQNGCVVSTVIKNSEIRTDHSKFSTIPYRGTWLVIDEFNRADIDKAFGQLFTALRTRNLKIPTNQVRKFYDDLKILKDYRIIGTLNTADKHFLFNLSDALKSRFAYIEVDIPKREQFEEEIYYAIKNALYELELESSFDKIIFDDTNKKINKEKSDSDFYKRLMQAYAFLDTVRIFKKLGTAVLKLIFQNLIMGVLITNNSKISLDNALTSNLIPQLENMSLSYVSAIHSMHSDTLDSFLKNSYADLNKQNHIQTFEKILNYLEIPDKEQTILDFEKGTIPNDSEVWNLIKNSFNKKKENFELKLDQLLLALEDLKKSIIL